jgi:hypothetical protein
MFLNLDDEDLRVIKLATDELPTKWGRIIQSKIELQCSEVGQKGVAEAAAAAAVKPSAK